MVNYSAPSYYRAGTRQRDSGNIKSGRIARGRYVNKTIVKKYKKNNRTKKSKSNLNKSAIMTLSKQVKLLQLQRYGSKQYQRQYAIIDNAQPLQECNDKKPLAFVMNSFYNANDIYQGNVSATGVPSATFTGIQLLKQVFSVDLKDQFQWNEQNAQETVSLIQYLPVYTKVKFTLSGMLKGGVHSTLPIRYRFTFFKLKNQPIVSDVHDMSLPETLGAYWYLCSDNFSTKNYFSKKRHEVLMDRYVSIQPPPADIDTLNVYRTIEMPFSFPSTKTLARNSTATPPGQTFNINIPQEDVIWCVISTNQVQNNGINVSIERLNIWRDAHGISTI